MSNILNESIQSNGLGYVKANIDGITFDKIKIKSKSTITPNPIMPASNGNLWKANTEDLSAWTGINAVDIDWNGAQVEENVIINTTGELLNWIKTKYNSSNSDNEKINEIENTIELYQEVFDSLMNTLLSKKYANDHFQEKGNYITLDQYNLLLNKIEYLENIINNNVQYNYYLGLSTEDQIQDQSYINSLDYNKFGIKPNKLMLPNGDNVFIYPAEWGTPTLLDSIGFEFGYYTADDLSINNPTGKIIRVYGVSANQETAYITWS